MLTFSCSHLRLKTTSSRKLTFFSCQPRKGLFFKKKQSFLTKKFVDFFFVWFVLERYSNSILAQKCLLTFFLFYLYLKSTQSFVPFFVLFLGEKYLQLLDLCCCQQSKNQLKKKKGKHLLLFGFLWSLFQWKQSKNKTKWQN